MANVPLHYVLMLAGALFVLGLLGVMARRNIVFILLSVEIMLNAAAVAFIAGGARWHTADGQVMVLLLLTMAATEVSVGLALVLRLHSQFHTLDIDAVGKMKG